MTTIDQAAKIVKDLANSGDTELAMDLFEYFEKKLNPHPAKINNAWNDDSVIWLSNFAAMCGYLVAKNIAIKEVDVSLKTELAFREISAKFWRDRALNAESELARLKRSEETVKKHEG